MLTFFLGPIGLLYVNVVAGLGLLVVAVVSGVLTFGVPSVVASFISIVREYVEASRKHGEFQTWLAANIHTGVTPGPMPVTSGGPSPRSWTPSGLVPQSRGLSGAESWEGLQWINAFFDGPAPTTPDQQVPPGWTERSPPPGDRKSGQPPSWVPPPVPQRLFHHDAPPAPKPRQTGTTRR